MRLQAFSILAIAATAFGVLTENSAQEPPRSFGFLLYDAFDLLDISGSIEVLSLLAEVNQLNLSLIAETIEPVYMRPVTDDSNPAPSNFQLSINPTHTFTNPPDIDVLFVPGGGGAWLGNITTTIDFVRTAYPKVKYLITVCTGAGVAARAGVLDGKRATTNKATWEEVTPFGPNVQWTSPARWVVDGNVWTASGVVSGIDLMLAFIETFYGEDIAHSIELLTEHKRTSDPCDDPFAAWSNVPPSGHC